MIHLHAARYAASAEQQNIQKHIRVLNIGMPVMVAMNYHRADSFAQQEPTFSS